MIELLIKYIEDKGFAVDVYPGRLHIYKCRGDECVAVNWMIAKHDLCYDFEEVLYYEAYRRCEDIDRMIEQKEHSERVLGMRTHVTREVLYGR